MIRTSTIYKPYKILMTAMSMGIGGAETHVLELSKFLKQNGVDVKVISNGGEYVRELQAANIEHINAPFHTKNISDMRKAKKILIRAMKKFQPDIVHAHARIPAFVASGVCKRMRVPLVTTVHGTYKTSPLLKLATHWGDYSLYVSNDVKDYLIKNYKLKEGRLMKTINAVNTELFSDVDDGTGTALRNELGIKAGEKLILSVSRIDKLMPFAAYAAVKLCNIAEQLSTADPSVRIVIVGDGDMFDELKARTEKINEKLGYALITMTGGRTDVYRFCRACDLFVGISRAALETLACAKPVILCGDSGYLGRFCAETKEHAEKTNFTCRGFNCHADIDAILFGDILACLDDRNAAEISSAKKMGAELVAEKYGVKRMADDAYAVYEEAILKYKKCDFVLTGYYGHENAGDNALLLTILANISQKSRAKKYKICVLAKKPKKLQKSLDNYFANIIVKSRFNIFHVRKAIKTSDALVFGGGTLLQDNTSNRSLSYYLLLLKMAQKQGKKTILYANGIGPIYSEKNKRRVAETVRNITLATIRDETAYNTLLAMESMAGTDSSQIYLTADEAITIRQNTRLDAFKRDFREYIKGDYIVISIRRWKEVGSAFFAEFAAAIDIICRETKLIPVYIVMERRGDQTLSENLAVLNSKGYVADGSDIEKILTIIRSASAVIAMRLHTAIFAAAFGVPMIGISYDPKVSGFLKDIYGSDDYTVNLHGFDRTELIEKFRALMSYKEDISAAITSSVAELCEKAEKNADLFIDEINKNT